MTEDDRKLLIEDVKNAEGWRADAYQDSVGVWTVGFGTNLQELTIDKKLGTKWLVDKLHVSEGECRRSFPWFDKLSPRRQRVLVEMTYNLGLTKLLGFQMTLGAIAISDFNRAAEQMLKSKWALQVGQRANRLADMMRKG